jgi:hypothetical protein
MENKNTNEELEYFQNKLKETMGKGLPKKYLETTDLGEVEKEQGIDIKERIEKHLTEVDKIKNMIDDNLKNQPTTDANNVLSAVNPIIDICGDTIDLRKVERVGTVGGDSSWLTYSVYFTGGSKIVIYHRQMKREKFVELWRSFNGC